MKRIALFGGGFNPVHNQHIINAEEALKQYDLDEIWFIPSKHHAFKGEIGDVSSDDRLKMIQLAIKANKKFKINTYELEQTNTQYSIDTINYFLLSFPDTKFYLLIGGDNLSTFHLWHKPSEILSKIELLIVERAGDVNKLNESLHHFLPHVHSVKCEQSSLSSSQIRKLLKEEKSIRYFVPENVYTFIKENKLYRGME